MNRFVIIALVIGILTGCAGAAQTQAPTATQAATSNPSPTPTLAPTPVVAAPTPTPSPASTPVGARELTAGTLEPGTFFAEVDGYRFTFTVHDSGWNIYAEAECCVIYKGGDSDGASVFLGGDTTSLYARACDSSGTDFEFGPSVDDLANALASLEDFETTEPTDVSLSGYAGKRVGVTVPTNVDVRSTECDQASYSLSADRWYQTSGQTDDMWILDLDGERQVIAFSKAPATPADLVTQLDEIRDSLVIEPL